MGRSERARPQHTPPGQQSRHRVQLRRLERFVAGEARQDRRHASRQHRLAGPGRADHQHVVASGRRDLEGAARLCLPSNVAEVDLSRSVDLEHPFVDRRRLPRSSEEPHHLGERRRRHDPKPVDLRGLERVRARHDHPLEPRACRRDRDREDPGGRHQLALQRELTGQRVSLERRGGDLSGGCQDARRDWEVEPRTLLAQGAWREIHDHPSQWPLEPLALDGRTDAVARVAHGGPRQPREREGREPSTDVGLDGHEVSPDPEHRHPEHPSVHAIVR